MGFNEVYSRVCPAQPDPLLACVPRRFGSVLIDCEIAGIQGTYSLREQLSRNIATRMAAAGFAITASVGFATFERAPETTSDALQMADKAMYAAKASGKSLREEPLAI